MSSNPAEGICVDRTGSRLSRGSLEQILAGGLLGDEGEFEGGRLVLVCGAPGVGKTTLSLHLARRCHEARWENDPEYRGRSALMLTLVETSEQILRIADLFGFRFRQRRSDPGLRIVESNYGAGEEPDLAGIFKAVGQEPRAGDILIIDGISVLRSKQETRDHDLAFVNQIRRLNLFAIVVSDQGGQDRFLEYAVDSIIRLNRTDDHLIRKLEIAKWRWRDSFPGPHTFRLLDHHHDPDGSGALIFPSIDCRLALREAAPEPETPGPVEAVPSGIEGFDELVEVPGGSFFPGDRIMLLGPPGVGKGTFGVQFLGAATRREGDRDGGRSVALSFAETHPELLRRLGQLPGQTREEMRPCHSLHYGSTNLAPDEVVGALVNLLDECERMNAPDGVTRLFVDGISDLRCRFPADRDYERFLLSFLRILSTYPRLVSLVSYEVPRIFASYSELTIPASDSFTAIVGLNFQEQHNRLTRGLILLKCRGRHHDAALKVAEITKKGTFRLDLRAGWPLVGLIGGQREQVREETPFLKLFHEPKLEKDVIGEKFEDFEGRYPNDHVFKMVPKSNPEPTHWSFLGYFGAGHSNTKLVVLRKYVMDVLRRRDVLLDVPRDFRTARFRDRYGAFSFWGPDDDASRVLVPYFADVGVMAYQQDLLAKLLGEEPGKVRVPATWDEILELKNSLTPGDLDRLGGDVSRNVRHLFVIPNAAEIKGFVAFLFELCWTYGFRFDRKKGEAEAQIEALVRGDAFLHATELLRELISRPDWTWRVVPNPTVGSHYQEAVLARRWFGRVHLSQADEEDRERENTPPFAFGIAELPGLGKKDPGISCLDLYAIGILRGALAPETAWMLADGLMGASMERDRALLKRGFPVAHGTFRSAAVQDALRTPPKHWGADETGIFTDYPTVLDRILSPLDPEQRRYQRTCDIPGFFYLERILAEEVSRLLAEQRPATIAEVRTSILERLRKEYRPYLQAGIPPVARTSEGAEAKG